MRFEMLTPNQSQAWADLLAISFERTPADMQALLGWLHGGYRLVAWGAWDGEKLVAQYSCRMVDLNLPGQSQPVQAGMSINMAVHPAYRGQGLIKYLARPVYERVAEMGGVCGVGFSNASGVKVDLKSQSYGYRVVGKLRSRLIWLNRDFQAGLDLSDVWPEAPFEAASFDGSSIHFARSPGVLRHRFALHPFRQYAFGIWQDAEGVRGIVVYRAVKIGWQRGAALLAVYGADEAELLRRWAGAIHQAGMHFVHVLLSPNAALRNTLNTLGRSLTLPYTRSPYFLTAKSLGEGITPPDIFDFARWDCIGGDIL